MKLEGEVLIRAPRHRVWEALNDPAVLSGCIPGCEELARITETETQARLLARIGPVRARFNGRIVMSDVEAPARCTLSFEGTGGAAGFAKGESVVVLDERGDATCLRYSVQAAIGGKLGQVGGRLVDSSARKMADEFFLAFHHRLAPPAEPVSLQPELSGLGPAVDVGLPAAAAGAAAEEHAAAASAGRPALGLAPELQRVFWLAVGAVIGGLAIHLVHIA